MLTRSTSRHLRPAQRTLLLAGLGLLSGLALTSILMLGLRSVNTDARTIADSALPAQQALDEAIVLTTDSQAGFQAAIASTDPTARALGVAASQEAGRKRDAAWERYRSHSLDSPGERAAQRSFIEATKRSRALGADLFTMDPLDPRYPEAQAFEEDAYEREVTTLEGLRDRYYEQRIRTESRAIVSGIDTTRNATLGTFAVVSLVFVGFGTLLLRSARRDERVYAAETAAMSEASARAAFETSLQRGLEMEPTEESVCTVIGQALAEAAPGLPVELLLAGSSRDHFSQVASTEPEAGVACGVGTPAECPATTTGRTQLFSDSSLLDTCPFLRAADPRVWAICTPLNVAGHAVGVIHAEGNLETEPPAALLSNLELVGRKGGERLGVLRVLAHSDEQAQIDHLTTLPNRRTLEYRARELVHRDEPFVVLFADLDHFKQINDLHGHETGDRALRLLSRVLRDSIRPSDIPARFGGEEFVALLPRCSMLDAHAVAERLRTNLARALGLAGVPPFTVSIGLAASEPGEAFADVVMRADAAMFEAKALGRDRIVTAGVPIPGQAAYDPSDVGSGENPREAGPTPVASPSPVEQPT